MAYALHRATLALHTPLGTPMAGDTLFGQLCWALREASGEAELTRQLEGYTQGQPWLVVSDGFPTEHLPKPTLPQHFEPQRDPVARKAAKKKRWIPANKTSETLTRLLECAVDDATAFGASPQLAMQAHNTLNRLTGTTGNGEFAPFSQPHTVHAARQAIDVYFAIDEARLTEKQIHLLLAAIGATGFGRDASTGLGKFTVEQFSPASLARPAQANAFWTLAPCAPQGQDFDGAQSYWRVLTRFGRHGNAHALSSNPFKTPVLLAASGAVLMPAKGFSERLFVGQGLGGDGKLSKTEQATVHQGYAPVVPITLESPR